MPTTKKKSREKNQSNREARVQRNQQVNQTHREWEGKLKKIFMGVALVVILLVAFGLWQNSQGQHQSPETAKVDLAADFSFKDINGTQITLSQFAGKPILVHFMTLAGCTGEMNPISYTKLPQLASVSSKYSDKVAIVSVCVATCAGCDSILANVRKDYSISWIIGNDYADEKLDIIESYSKCNLYDGTVVLIDKSFNIARVYEPDATLYAFTTKIDQLV